MESYGRLFELLKATGWQTGMIAVSAGAYLFLVKVGWIPEPPSEWVLAGAWILLLTSGALALAPVLEALHKAVSAKLERKAEARKREAAREQAKDRFRRDIPYLDDRERKIFGYLLEKGTKNFFASDDAGYAANLLGKGYVVRNMVNAQVFDVFNMPMAVPDHIWEVLIERRDEFPYEPVYGGRYGDQEVQPWRRPM